ncbi:MAG: hypothetical protein ACYS32_01390 [Planctomycetota bacterium]|jgi:hypothetical protein
MQHYNADFVKLDEKVSVRTWRIAKFNHFRKGKQMKSTKISAILVLGLVICQINIVKAAPMGTAWTYQGRLMDTNEPGDGLYDFQFNLFDDGNTVTGNPVGIPVNKSDVDVIEGYFTVELDFGGDVFDGNSVWLEIIVRPGDSNDVSDFVTLSPRQQVTPTPNAIYAAKAPWSGLAGIPLGFADGVDNNTTYSAGNQLKLAVGNIFNVLEGTGSGLDADLLDGQHGSFYRSASNINSGTLDNGLFSAYSDLSSEGYLDDDADGDLLTRSQADGRYVNEGQSDSVTSGMILNAAQGAAGTASIYGSITNNTVTEMDSFTVNVPGPGTLAIFVMGHVYLDCDSTSSSSRLCFNARIGICDTSGSSASCGTSYSQSRLDFEDPDNVSNINEEKWIVVARTVSVSAAGNRTFYLNGQSTNSGMDFRIAGYVVATFTPNSMTVTNP